MIWKQRNQQLIKIIPVLIPFKTTPLCVSSFLKPALPSCNSISSSGTLFNSGFHPSRSISQLPICWKPPFFPLPNISPFSFPCYSSFSMSHFPYIYPISLYSIPFFLIFSHNPLTFHSKRPLFTSPIFLFLKRLLISLFKTVPYVLHFQAQACFFYFYFLF